MLGPDAGAEPGDVIVVGDVAGPQVEAESERDVGEGVGDRDGPRTAHRDADRRGRADDRAVVRVLVAIGEEAQAGRGADLDQRERLGQRSEYGQERSASCHFVRLHGSPQQLRADVVPPLVDEPTEPLPAVGGAIQEPHDREEQVGLLDARRQSIEPFAELCVQRHAACERRVARR